MCWRLVKVAPRQDMRETSQSHPEWNHWAHLQNIHHHHHPPPSSRLYPLHPSARQMCRPQQIPARLVLCISSSLREPVCPAATPGRRSIATILIALLSPSIVAAHCVKLTVSLSARFHTHIHTVARGAAERSTATHTVQEHTKTRLLHSPDRLVNRHL